MKISFIDDFVKAPALLLSKKACLGTNMFQRFLKNKIKRFIISHVKYHKQMNNDKFHQNEQCFG